MITSASRESVRRWFYSFSKTFSIEKKVRRAVAVDERVVKVYDREAYICL